MELCRLVSDGRHERGVARLEEIEAQDVTPEKIYDVLSDPHVMQGNTQFTALMNPSTNEYSTTARTEHPRFRQDPSTKLVEAARSLINVLLKIAPFVQKAPVVV